MELKITVRVRCNSIPLSDIHHITINMKNVYAFVYCDGDMIPSYKWIMFECPSDSKVIIIKEDMLLDALRDCFSIVFPLSSLGLEGAAPKMPSVASPK